MSTPQTMTMLNGLPARPPVLFQGNQKEKMKRNDCHSLVDTLSKGFNVPSSSSSAATAVASKLEKVPVKADVL